MRFLKWILIVILSLVTLFFMMAGYLYLVRVNDLRLERRHHRELTAYYGDDYVPIDESQFINFDPMDPSITLADIQILASHNSYKKNGPALGHFFVGLGENFDEARALDYGYQPLTTQFELGIRSMELDVRLRAGRFEITHVPLVDASSVSVTLEGALNEMKLYSDHNPDHMPMIFLLEIKDDWMMLDPKLESINEAALIDLNDLIASTLGDTLITPKDIMQGDLTLRETIIDHGWPSLSTMLGKHIIVIHPGTYSQMFATTFSDRSNLNVFIGAYASEQDQDYASFFVENTPNIETIGALVDQNFIVRTRIDADLSFTDERMTTAIQSGAQILTSDFVIGRSDLDEAAIIFLGNRKTVVVKS